MGKGKKKVKEECLPKKKTEAEKERGRKKVRKGSVIGEEFFSPLFGHLIGIFEVIGEVAP